MMTPTPDARYSSGLRPPYLDEIYNEASKFGISDRGRSNTRIARYLSDLDLVGHMSSPSGVGEQWCGPVLELTAPANDLLDQLALRRSRRTFGDAGVDDAALAVLLSVYRQDVGPEGHLVSCIPSGGGLFPLELFVARVDDGCLVSPRWFDPRGFRLVAREDDEPRPLTSIGMLESSALGASCIVFIAANFARCRAKYGERAYRLTQMEAGSCAAMMQVLAADLGLASYISAQFFDAEVEAYLGLDGVERAFASALIVGGAPT